MTAAVPYSLKATGTTATTSVASFTAPSVGDTLLAMITIPTANAPATAIVDSTGYDLLASPDLVVTGMNGFTYYFVRRSNIAGSAPSSISVTGTTGSFSSIVEVMRVTGMTATSPKESTFNTLLSSGASQTTHLHSYTTLHANNLVMFGSSTSGARNLTGVTSVNMTVVATESGGSTHHLAYLADAGAAGSYQSTATFNSATTCTAIGVIYRLTDAPTVSTVSSNSATEGSAITHTVTLSGTTSATEYYAATLVGVTATGSGTDFTSDLASATYSNGVTFSGGNMAVPSGVSSFTVTIATTSDTTDETDETYTLTVGGVSGTGTITDDDAPPSITVTDASENAMQVVFTVSLSQASGKTITVDYATANGTKTAGTDYTAAAGTLTFNPGETSKTVTVTVL